MIGDELNKIMHYATLEQCLLDLEKNGHSFPSTSPSKL